MICWSVKPTFLPKVLLAEPWWQWRPVRQGRLAVTSFFSLSREGIVFSFSACGQYLRKERGARNYLQDLDDLSAIQFPMTMPSSCINCLYSWVFPGETKNVPQEFVTRCWESSDWQCVQCRVRHSERTQPPVHVGCCCLDPSHLLYLRCSRSTGNQLPRAFMHCHSLLVLLFIINIRCCEKRRDNTNKKKKATHL